MVALLLVLKTKTRMRWHWRQRILMIVGVGVHAGVVNQPQVQPQFLPLTLLRDPRCWSIGNWLVQL